MTTATVRRSSSESCERNKRDKAIIDLQVELVANAKGFTAFTLSMKQDCGGIPNGIVLLIWFINCIKHSRSIEDAIRSDVSLRSKVENASSKIQ